MSIKIEVGNYQVILKIEADNFKYEEQLSEYNYEKNNHITDDQIDKFICISRDLVNFNRDLDDTDLVIKTIEICNLSIGQWEKILEHFKISFDKDGYVQQEA